MAIYLQPGETKFLPVSIQVAQNFVRRLRPRLVLKWSNSVDL
jgi:hypothetical protein